MNSTPNITAEDISSLKNQIEVEKLKVELDKYKKVPFLNRLVNSYMDSLNCWSRWVTQNQIDMIKAERGCNIKMNGTNSDNYLDLTEQPKEKIKKEERIEDFDFLGVPKMDMDLFELNF